MFIMLYGTLKNKVKKFFSNVRRRGEIIIYFFILVQVAFIMYINCVLCKIHFELHGLSLL